MPLYQRAFVVASHPTSGPALTPLPLAQLYELTGISPERQKLTLGAKQITEKTDLASMGLKKKQVFACAKYALSRSELARARRATDAAEGRR
jgi:hypothetical protein